jgi:hypothetical protein
VVMLDLAPSPISIYYPHTLTTYIALTYCAFGAEAARSRQSGTPAPGGPASQETFNG